MSVSIQHSVYPQKPCRTFEDWYHKLHYQRPSKGKTVFISSVWDESNPLTEIQRKWTAMKMEHELSKVEQYGEKEEKPFILKQLLITLGKAVSF